MPAVRINDVEAYSERRGEGPFVVFTHTALSMRVGAAPVAERPFHRPTRGKAGLPPASGA